MFSKIKPYVPGTQARQDRLFRLSLMKRLGDHEVLLQVEWPDGSESYKPASWSKKMSAWVTDDDLHFFSVGKGGDVGSLLGVPVVHVDAMNAGVVSKEAAKASAREEKLAYVDEDGNPMEVTETNDEGEPIAAKGANGEQALADGGELNLNYDMNPQGLAQDTDADYVGEVIDRSLAGYYDPFPVKRDEIDQAIETARSAGQDSMQDIKLLLIGVAIGLGVPVLLWILSWLMTQIGGDGGGSSSGGVSLMINNLHTVGTVVGLA